MSHWHAYAHTGRALPDSAIRRGEAPSTYPPFELRDWLRRRPESTFTDPEAAAKWLHVQGEEHPPVDADAFPVDTRVRYAESTLAQEAGADVVWGYYSAGGQYVSRALITCPRPPHPTGPPPACPDPA
ncbi:hypothetical protein AB0N09_21795 [Streptomyces erythrochromogenes]|uniref:hypothetical protein n=1 Tax=Streptomyces erythrochromogenes TaxID=285574 RepID=UPI003442DC12